ncbi:MAG: mechanosensitive ion channel [Anaerolineae bacterium]|nr:mechanosensitive ion channel [Anaerolineae bacterium]
MGPFLDEFLVSFGAYALNFGGAALILVGGWIIALLISAGVRRLLERVSIDNQLAQRMGMKESFKIEELLARIVFWIIMLFVIVAVFQALQLTAVTGPLNSLLNEVFAFIPNLLAAAGLAFLAWVLATLLRFVVSKALGATRIDDTLTREAGLDEGRQVPMSETLATIIYWFVLLLFLPAILGALGMNGLLAPIQNMVNDLLGFLPNVLGAAIILLVGWFVARIIRQIVTNLLIAVGTDELGARMGLTTAIGQQSLSAVIGTIVYVLILIPVIISALDTLDIAAISEPATNMLNTLLDAIPNIFGAMIILVLAYFIGRLVAGLVTTLLSNVGFDRVLNLIGLGQQSPTEGQRTPSEIAGYLVLIGIMLFATIEAANILGFEFLAVLVSEFLVFAGRVILAIIIFGIGLYLANLARTVVLSLAGAQANLLSQLARVAIIVLTTAMALRQMGIADDIVNLAFGLTLGAIAVAAALAFGLGSRDIAGREVESWVSSFRSSSPPPPPSPSSPPAPRPSIDA